MNFKFFPHTEEETQEMLKKIGVKNINDLFANIPDALRFKGEYDIPEAKSELEIRNFFNALGDKNKLMTCFAGAGVYDHYTQVQSQVSLSALSSSRLILRIRLKSHREPCITSLSSKA